MLSELGLRPKQRRHSGLEPESIAHLSAVTISIDTGIAARIDMVATHRRATGSMGALDSGSSPE